MKTTLTLTLFSILFLLGGCLGKEEISDLAIVTAVGIDQGEDGTILLTAQVARPAEVRGDAGAGGGTGEPMWTARAEGKTIFEAIRNLARFSSRRVYWGHNMVIAIGESVAEDGIVDVLDFFTRNNELRMNTWVVVTEKASELIPMKTGVEVLPGDSIDKLFRYSEIVAEAPRSNVMSLSIGYLNEELQPYLATVSLSDVGISEEGQSNQEYSNLPQVELTGTALFRGDKMVGKLNARESRGFLWFVETVGTAIVPLTLPDSECEVSIELRENSFGLTPRYENGEISFVATIETVADLVELGCPTSKEHSEIFKLLEPELENYIKEDVEMMLDKLQNDYLVDSIGLSRNFRAKYPKQWREVKDNWEDIFPTIPVDVQVHAEINNPQLFKLPTRPLKD